MKNDNQDKIIKEKFNQYIDNIEIPKNLEEVIMKNMKDIEKNEVPETETQEKEVKGKTFNFKRFLGSAAAVVVIAGVATITSFEMGWIGEKQNNNVVAEKQSEAGKNTLLASNEQIKSLYDIQEYTDNLTDDANGKLAFLKLLENNELPLEEEDYYYVYKDDTYGMMIGDAYYIKEITNVTSEEGMMGNDGWAALFKVTVEYINDNDETQTFDLAIILLPNHEVQNKGKYLNYTGTTAFVKGFTDLYEDDEAKIEKLFLDKLKKLDEKNPEKLLDYRVDNIKILTEDDKKYYLVEDNKWEEDDILAYVTYSVKPNDVKTSNWLSGNGKIEGEWIVNKVSCECMREGELVNKEGFATSFVGNVDTNLDVDSSEENNNDDRNKIDDILYELENGEATVSFSIGTTKKYVLAYPIEKRGMQYAVACEIGSYGKLDYLTLSYDKNDKIDNIAIYDRETKEKISTNGNTTFEEVEKFYKDNEYINVYKCKDVPGVDIDIILVKLETESDDVTIRHDFENDILKNITVYEEDPAVIEQINKEQNATEKDETEKEIVENDQEKIDEIMYDIENVRGDMVDFSLGNSKSHMALYFGKYDLDKDSRFYDIGNYGKLDYIALRYDENDKINDMVICNRGTEGECISIGGRPTYEEVEDYYKNNKHINVYKGNDTILVELDNENDDIVIKHDFENNSLKNITVYVNYALVTGEI